MFQPMTTHPRHPRIVESLRRAGRVDVLELAADLGTSEITIRRDLDQLAAQGILRRVRGGAVSLMMRGDELPFGLRELESSPAKQLIAARVAELLIDGEAVIVDSGTSGLAVARALANHRGTVLPLSLPAADALADHPSVTLVMPGGSVRAGERTFVGPLTEATLASLRFDTYVLSVCGFSVAHGVTAHDLQDRAVKQAAMAASARTIAVADGAKFAITAMGVVCRADEVDILVTDDSVPREELDAVQAAGVDVQVCATGVLA